MNYQNYLQSEHWKKLRAKRYRLRDNCRICGSSNILNLHHKTYKNIGNERHADLVVLCQDCHHLWHKIYRFKKLKTKNIDRIKNLIKYGMSKQFAFENCIGLKYITVKRGGLQAIAVADNHSCQL